MIMKKIDCFGDKKGGGEFEKKEKLKYGLL